MQLFDLPFLFKDKDHLYKVMDGEVGNILKSKIDAKKQMIALDYWDAGFKHFSTNAKPMYYLKMLLVINIEFKVQKF